MKFKTNAKCSGCTSAILKALAPLAPESEWTFDLASPDKTLAYIGSAALSVDEVVNVIRNAGFSAEQL